MVRKSLVVILGLVIAAAWIGTSYSQESSGPVLRILSYTAVPGKQEELLNWTAEDIPKLYAGRKGIQWYRIYYDPSSGEMGTVTIWNSQADVDAFMNSDARKAVVEKYKPIIQGDITTKVYRVYEPKK